MDELQKLKEKLAQFENRLKILEDYYLPKAKEAARKEEQQLRHSYRWLLWSALNAKQDLQHYRKCKLIRKLDGLYYRELGNENEGEIRINIPWGAQQLKNVAYNAGLKKIEDLFDKELAKRKLELWHKFFNQDKIEKLLEKIENVELDKISQIYDIEGFKKKLKDFRES